MAILQAARSFNQFVTDTTNVRDVSEQMVLLEPDAAPLFVLTNAAKRKQPTIGPRFEWVEDTEVSLWGHASSTGDFSSVATTLNVADSTVFGIGDIVAVPKAQSSSAAPEVFLVTGASNNSLVNTRGIGGSGADTIGQTQSVRILASAFKEDDNIGQQRYTAKTVQIQLCPKSSKLRSRLRTPLLPPNNTARHRASGSSSLSRRSSGIARKSRVLVCGRARLKLSTRPARAGRQAGMAQPHCHKQDGCQHHGNHHHMEYLLGDGVPLRRKAEVAALRSQGNLGAKLLLAEQVADAGGGYSIRRQDCSFRDGARRVLAGKRLSPRHR